MKLNGFLEFDGPLLSLDWSDVHLPLQWDELCLICGLKPKEGPKLLFPSREECLDKLVGHLNGLETEMDGMQLWKELEDILSLLEEIQDADPDTYTYAMFREIYPGPLPYLPFNPGDPRVIAIGTFDDRGESIRGERTCLPRGYVSCFWTILSSPYYLVASCDALSKPCR
jgi:hypothetical protein